MARQRRGGFRPPELRGTLGTLLRTTREVLERGAREGRTRLDEALSGRRRDHALAELGEIVLELIRRGEIDVAELPEAQAIVAQLEEIDAGEPPARAHDEVATPPSRRRFDERDQDDTVSSGTWSPPTRATPAAKVWRPPGTERTERSASPTLPGKTRIGAPPAAARKGGISFDEDPDADLADYMHPDDVPPKGKDKDKDPSGDES